MLTENKYIFRAKEKFYSYKDFLTKFKDFEDSIRSKNENDVDDFLTKSCVIEKTLTPYHTCPLPKNKVLPNI